MRFNIFRKNLKYDVNSTESDKDINRIKNYGKLETKTVAIQVAISFLANVSAISVGMGFGYPAVTSEVLLSEGLLTPSLVSWFASITAIICPFGGPLSGYLTDKFGRKFTLMYINVLAIVSWLIIGFSSRTDAETLFIQLMVSRALIGYLIGSTNAPTVMYSTEICHPSLRGRLTIMSTPFFVAFGSLIAYLLGFLMPTEYRMVAFFGIGISICSIIILFFIPESPVFLVTKNKLDEARKALSILRNLNKNDPRIDVEIESIKSQKSQPTPETEKTSIFQSLQEFKKPGLYKPFLIMFIFFVIQQFSGIFVMFIYAAKFSSEAGVEIDEFFSAVLLGVIRCLTTILIAFASDMYGRRPLVIVSGLGMFMSMVALAILSAFPVQNASWLAAFLLYFYAFIGTIGILTLPFAMLGEIYPQKSRGVAAGLTISLCFIMNFVNLKTFSDVFEYFGGVGVFSFYAFMSLLGALFGIFILPETKGKSLEEIEEMFNKK